MFATVTRAILELLGAASRQTQARGRGGAFMTRYGPYGIVSVLAAVILILLLLQLAGIIAIF